jgi:hypothetical protein
MLSRSRFSTSASHTVISSILSLYPPIVGIQGPILDVPTIEVPSDLSTVGSIPGHFIFSEGTSHLAPHHGIALSLTGCLLQNRIYN